jgi:hypothetical protein
MTAPPLSETEDVAVRLGRALDAVGIRYLIGGSVASSLVGEPRATNDLDVLVELAESQVPALAEALGPDFDVDTESLADAVRRRGSWNIFYLPLVTKIDLFIKQLDPFDAEALNRRRRVGLPGGSVWVASPEDILLRKLSWFRRGGEVAGQQWRDILGILAISGQALDREYVTRWASTLGVDDLWVRAERASRGRERG